MDGSKVGQVWVVSDPPDDTSVGPSLTGPYIMLVYLMLFAALSNAVCLYHALFSSFRH